MSIFLKIIARELPANIVYEDDLCIAFLDISQVTKGHTLVVPKKRFENIFQLPEDLASHLFKVSKKVSIALKKAFQADGLNIVNNNGAAAGQQVFHYHIHLIPRYVGDDYLMLGTNHSSDYTKEDLITIRDDIIKALL